MKVKSIQDVDIRMNTPSVLNNNKKGLLYSSFEIEVEEIEGQEINGNKTWFKDKNGDFYWSGGFEKKENLVIQPPISSNLPDLLVNNFDINNNSLKAPINYFQLLDIHENYKEFRSNDFLVAIIDTPINTNLPGLKNFFDSPSIFTNLKVDHGTYMAGLIGGENKTGITGIAPHIIMHEVPAIDNFGHPIEGHLIDEIKSLLKLSENKILVINVSMNIRPEGEIKTQMDKLCEKCIVIAAAGEDTELESLDKRQYPSSNPNSISVGKYSKAYFETGNYSKILNEVDVLVPEFHFVSYNRSVDQLKYMTNCGDSCSCAIVTGTIGLLLSSNSCSPDVKSIREKLKEISFHISDINNFNKLRLVRTK